MELADAVGGEHAGDQDPLAEAAMSLQSPSGSPRRDGFSRGAGHVSPQSTCLSNARRLLSSMPTVCENSWVACCVVSMLPGQIYCKGPE